MIQRIIYVSILLGAAFLFTGSTAQNELLEIIAQPVDCNVMIDVMIVVDGSYSVTASNFQLVKEWIKDLARGLEIDRGHVQIGVVQYSYWYSTRPMWRQRYIQTEIQLGEFDNQDSFDAAVDGIRYQGYRTFTAHAINKTVDYDFRSEKNRYPEAQRAIILLTDGKATDAKDLPGAVKHAEEDEGVAIFTVGVGDYSIDELLILTSGKRERIFELKNFDELATIVYELPKILRQACDCEDQGSINNECDPCTRQCACKLNVVGRRCDQCAPGHFNFLGAADGCEACNCHPLGTVGGNVCDPNDGQCMCKPDKNVTGERCDRCPDGMYGLPECTACECNGFAVSCSVDFGICIDCAGNRAGIHCETCRTGYYIYNEECVPCECNGNIDVNDPEACDATTGECMRCLHGTGGPRCEICADNHYRDQTSGQCESCQCNAHGTESSSCQGGNCTCDPVTGQCLCVPNVIGTRCDTCADGFWDLGNGKGCKACGCHGLGSPFEMCDKVTGECTCLPGHTGQKCDQCEHGHTRASEEDLCTACDCNLGGVVKAACEDGVCSCDVTGQCACLPNVVGKSCDECLDNYWDFGSEVGCELCGCHPLGSVSPACDKNSGECECLPGHRGMKCEDCSMGYFMSDLEGQCRECVCNIIGTSPSACEVDVCECDALTSQCPCLPNVVGLSCEKCDEGYWGLDEGEGCKACGCDPEGSISSDCNKKTGECECLPGHTGTECELCSQGFFRTSPDEPCRACSCNMYGRLPSSCEGDACTCEAVTGQCVCLPNVAGVSCDRCLDGFWDLRSMEGCKPCDCHRNGSSTEICEKKTGQCECLDGQIGRTCDECQKGYKKEKYDYLCAPDSLNDEPEPPDTEEEKTNPPPVTDKPTTTTTAATTTTTRITTTRRIPATRRPFTTRRPILPWRPVPTTPRRASTTRSTGYYYGCPRCTTWPSYCRGWMCHRRWPHHTFTPAPTRCNYGNLMCRHNVEMTAGHNARLFGNKMGKSTTRTTTTMSSKRMPTSRRVQGYRAYNGGSNYNSYMPYYVMRPHLRNVVTNVRSSRAPSMRRSKPLASFGLYRNNYGKK